jgi:YNFM family putative membrane transporter
MLLSPVLPLVLGGMVLVAVGTFFAQAVATGFLSKATSHGRGAASGMYLASYFFGGLVGTAVLGQMFDHLGWPACVAGVGASLLAAALLTRRLKVPKDAPEQ